MPPAGVPTLPPRPSIRSGARRGSISSADSAPRTQCGTITGSVCTLSKPSFLSCASSQSIARSSEAEPLSRWPCVSTSSANRMKPVVSASAPSMSLLAVAR